jgi:hypothetical protein
LLLGVVSGGVFLAALALVAGIPWRDMASESDAEEAAVASSPLIAKQGDGGERSKQEVTTATIVVPAGETPGRTGSELPIFAKDLPAGLPSSSAAEIAQKFQDAAQHEPVAEAAAKLEVTPQLPLAVANAPVPVIAASPDAAPETAPLEASTPLGTGSLFEQGQELLRRGDVAGARVLFERAVDDGVVEAAFALGSTFDPIGLKRYGLQDVVPDSEKALYWYRKGHLMSEASSRTLTGAP